MDFSASKCKGYWLHKFLTIKDNGEYVLERCARCGERNVIKVVAQQLDVVRYSKLHMREFIIPQHRLYLHEFIKKTMNRAARRANQYG